jgi:hypothetical protein
VTNDVDMDADTTPPGRVTDLRVTNQPGIVQLEFTAPGDDLDSNDAAIEYDIKYSSTTGNLTGENFDNNEFNTRITNEDLTGSNLIPETGGTIKTINIKDYIFNKNEKFVIAMKAMDEAGNKSPVSNKVQIFLPAPALLGTTSMSPATTTSPPTYTSGDPPPPLHPPPPLQPLPPLHPPSGWTSVRTTMASSAAPTRA